MTEKIVAAYTDKNTIKVMALLKDCPISVGMIHKKTKIPNTEINKIITKLSILGILEASQKKRGLFVPKILYHINDESI